MWQYTGATGVGTGRYADVFLAVLQAFAPQNMPRKESATPANP
jgi:hypothetical protein